MKKALHWIMGILAAVVVVLVGGDELGLFSVGLVSVLLTIVLLVVAVFYACCYGGIRCPNCGCRINPKYGRQKAFDSRFPCPKCGAMIEL